MLHIAPRDGAEAVISPTHFTTRLLPAGEQFAAWRELNASVVEMSLVDSGTPGFAADQLSWDLDGMRFTQATLPATAERQWHHWPKSSMDDWCLVLARGPHPAHAAGAAAGHLGFRSLARPFDGRGADEEVLTLFLPRHHFGKEAQAFDSAPAMSVRNGMAAILMEFMTTLARHLGTVSRQDLPRLRAATGALVTACLAPAPDHVMNAEGPMNALLFKRARRLVQQHMASPAFSPDALCRALAVSRSRLYRVFESHGGVAHFIQQERLREAHRRLGDPWCDAPINVLASETGFIDHSSFSRAFKRAYGYSPREAREIAMAKRLQEPLPPQQGPDGDAAADATAFAGTTSPA